MSDNRAIGVFDSGLGGLTVVREIFRLMPSEKVVYLGDTARCPYGGRSNETIKEFAKEDASFLMKKDIKMLIVACNTVSSVALREVKEIAGEIPVIGVVAPGAHAAASKTELKKVGVIGTTATIRNGAYAAAIQSYNPDIKVYSRECPLFVPLVEEGLLDHEITRMTAEFYLYELVDTGIDTLILGCTHYPLLFELIKETVGSEVRVVDSALWTVKKAKDILSSLDLLRSEQDGNGILSDFYVTDHIRDFEGSAKLFLGRELKNVHYIHLDYLTSCNK